MSLCYLNLQVQAVYIKEQFITKEKVGRTAVNIIVLVMMKARDISDVSHSKISNIFYKHVKELIVFK